MKVLHVIDALGVGGGAEHSLATLLPLLRERGVDGSVSTILPREGGLQADLIAQGFDVEVLPSTSWPGRVRALRARIRDVRPDLVHATLLNSCLVTRVAGIGTGVPQVNSLVNTSYDPVRIRELKIPKGKLRVYRIADGFTARHLVDGFHAITESVRNEAIEVLGVPPERITVIPRGRAIAAMGEPSEQRRSAGRERLGIGPDTGVVLNVGRQDAQKGQDGLVRAFARVHAVRPDTVLLIAGRDGSATPEIHRALDEAGFDDWGPDGSGPVRLLGHRTDIGDLYAAADVFAFPSLYEGLGCSLIEAMALATPIVGSDAPAVAEVVEHAHSGVVVPRADDERLATALLELLADPARRHDLGERGRAEYLARYELDRVVDATISLYEQIRAAH